MSAPSRPLWIWKGIAEAYREAAESNEKVTLAVQRYLANNDIHTSLNSVTHYWIANTRRKGYLESTVKGRVLGANPRLRAVAAALNVDPEELRWAIQEYANGRLAVGKNP